MKADRAAWAAVQAGLRRREWWRLLPRTIEGETLEAAETAADAAGRKAAEVAWNALRAGEAREEQGDALHEGVVRSVTDDVGRRLRRRRWWRR